MDFSGPNPVPLHSDKFQISTTPLFLIHDGGGTITPYYGIGSLGRDVYGIFNPRFDMKRGRPVNLTEMAEDYCRRIKETIGDQEDILLGGWSLGGFVALEMSRIFALDPDVNVVGLVMIECVYPRAIEANMFSMDDVGASAIPKALRERVLAGIKEAVDMVRAWDPPNWDGEGISPPPAVLFRAKGSLPSRPGEVTPKLLGWERYGYEIFQQVYDVPGHHFSIFNDGNVGALTSALAEACMLLEMSSA